MIDSTTFSTYKETHGLVFNTGISITGKNGARNLIRIRNIFILLIFDQEVHCIVLCWLPFELLAEPSAGIRGKRLRIACKNQTICVIHMRCIQNIRTCLEDTGIVGGSKLEILEGNQQGSFLSNSFGSKCGILSPFQLPLLHFAIATVSPLIDHAIRKGNKWKCTNIFAFIVIDIEHHIMIDCLSHTGKCYPLSIQQGASA